MTGAHSTLPDLDARRAFFDGLAPDYADTHGDPAGNLARRLAILRVLLGNRRVGRLVEIGCGPGDHIRGLAPLFATGAGVDFSRAMVARARAESRAHPNLEFICDDAERLDFLQAESADCVFCVGMLEHTPDKASVFRSVYRVLVPGGTFVCLTVNGSYLLHRIGAAFGREVRFLPTDRFVSPRETKRLSRSAGYRTIELGRWSFVPSGTLPAPAARLLNLLDRIGIGAGIGTLRGGLWFRAAK